MKKDNNQMMMGSTATNSCTNNTTHYCSVNDAHLNPQGVGEHHKNRKQTIENNVSRDENTVHSFCGPSSSATNSSTQQMMHQSQSGSAMLSSSGMSSIPPRGNKKCPPSPTPNFNARSLPKGKSYYVLLLDHHTCFYTY